MGNPKRYLSKTAAFLLAVLISLSLCSCAEKTAEPTTEAIRETAAATESARITVGTITCDSYTRELTLADAQAQELEELLPQLTVLETLTLEGTLPDWTALVKLQSRYPEIAFRFQVAVGGREYPSDAEALDFSGTSVTPEELLQKLPLFRQLKEVSLLGTGLTEMQSRELAESYTDLFVLCELTFGGKSFRTDREEMDISNCTVTVEEAEAMLAYFPRLRKLDMSFCGIANEEMEALNQRHPEVDIVWTLKIGEVYTRTDTTFFYPAGQNYYPTSGEMDQLRYCHDLIAVDIGHTRATDCEFLWYTPQVRYLILADTGITDIAPVGNLKELIYLELFNLRLTDYSPLLNCTKLQDLNIGTTHADPEPLSKMTWLHNLQWHRADQNPETVEAVLKLPEQLPDTNVVLFPKKKARNIGGPWRYIPNYYVFRDLIGATYFNQDQIGDYWGQEDGDRIMACDGGKGFCADTLAEIIRERIDKGEPIIGLKNTDSQKAEILYETLKNAGSFTGER